MLDYGAVLVIVTITAVLPPEGFAARRVAVPTVTATQYATKAICEDIAERWRENLEDYPVPGRTVKVFCVTP